MLSPESHDITVNSTVGSSCSQECIEGFLNSRFYQKRKIKNEIKTESRHCFLP